MIVIKHKGANLTFSDASKNLSVADFDKLHPRLSAPRDIVYKQLTGKEYKAEKKPKVKVIEDK